MTGGLCGFLRLDEKPAEMAHLQSMMSAMRHWGNEAGQSWLKGSFALGYLFYSKWLFGKTWRNASGLTREQLKPNLTPLKIGIAILMSSCLAFFMVGFCNDIGQEGQFDNFGHGASSTHCRLQSVLEQ